MCQYPYRKQYNIWSCSCLNVGLLASIFQQIFHFRFLLLVNVRIEQLTCYHSKEHQQLEHDRICLQYLLQCLSSIRIKQLRCDHMLLQYVMGFFHRNLRNSRYYEYGESAWFQVNLHQRHANIIFDTTFHHYLPFQYHKQLLRFLLCPIPHILPKCWCLHLQGNLLL